jgi:O-antigen/teichoic acid export membrane protein
MAMVGLTEPLNKALAPWLFEQLAKNDEAVRRMIVRRTYLLFAALALLGLVVAAAAHLLFEQLIDSRYAPARALIPWMVGGFVLQGLYTSVVNYLFYAERTGRLSVASASTAVMGCGVSWFMTTHYGLQGAAMSFAFNSAVLFLLVWVSAARAVPMPWWHREC